MTIEVWISFVFTASIILIIPGPTIIYVVGQSLAHGKKASLPLSIGVIAGDAICIIISLLGLSFLLNLFSIAFVVVKYFGATYLIYLGIKMIRSKGIIFYSAFMPQFVNPHQNILFQFGLLAVTFLSLALINVVGYSLLASKTNELFKSIKFSRTFNLTGGLSLICAGLYSATIEKK